jgi:hypothetical protein
MGTYLEYGRVPPQLRAPLVHALLGTLHIRCIYPQQEMHLPVPVMNVSEKARWSA